MDYLLHYRDITEDRNGTTVVAADDVEQARIRFLTSNVGVVIRSVEIFFRRGRREWTLLDERAAAEGKALGQFNKNFKLRFDGPSRKKCRVAGGPLRRRQRVSAIFGRIQSSKLFEN